MVSLMSPTLVVLSPSIPERSLLFSPQLCVLKIVSLIPKKKTESLSTTWAVSSLACPKTNTLRIESCLPQSYEMGCVLLCVHSTNFRQIVQSPFPLHENPTHLIILMYLCPPTWVVFFTCIFLCMQSSKPNCIISYLWLSFLIILPKELSLRWVLYSSIGKLQYHYWNVNNSTTLQHCNVHHWLSVTKEQFRYGT